MPKRRISKVRFKLPRIRIDLMNMLIALAIMINLALVASGVRHCWGRRTEKAVPTQIPIAKSEQKMGQQETTELKAKASPPEPQKKVPIQIEVLNGCGAPKIADKFTAFLRRRGFDVVKTANYENFNVPKTLVIDRKGNSKNAIRLAETLGLKKTEVIQEIHDMFMVDATIVLGKDFRMLPSWKTLEKNNGKK